MVNYSYKNFIEKLKKLRFSEDIYKFLNEIIIIKYFKYFKIFIRMLENYLKYMFYLCNTKYNDEFQRLDNFYIFRQNENI